MQLHLWEVGHVDIFCGSASLVPWFGGRQSHGDLSSLGFQMQEILRKLVKGPIDAFSTDDDGEEAYPTPGPWAKGHIDLC